MSGAGTFTVVNDKTLCEAIAATEQSLVCVAPGVTKPVVDAIGASLRMDSSGKRLAAQLSSAHDAAPEV